MKETGLAEEILKGLMRGYVIPGAYERWKPYRNSVTEYLISHAQKGTDLMIIGAGEANDFDLRRLHGHFGTICLVDRDLEAMQRALLRDELTNALGIILIKKDFVGITREEYIKLIELCLSEFRKEGNPGMAFREKTINSRAAFEQTRKKYIDCLAPVFERVNAQNVFRDLPVCNYVAAFGIHSQLFALPSQIWALFLEAAKVQDEDVFRYVKKQNDTFIPEFTEGVLKLAKSKAFFGLEEYAFESEGAVEGAVQGIRYLWEHKREGDYEIAKTVWPFLEDRNYQMMLFTVDRNPHT